MFPFTAGPGNTVLDVDGVRVAHATRDEPGWLTGCTVLVTPDGGAVGGVDVRGGGPGTRETDLLDPRNLVDRVHAVALAGGSAFGLAAADGVMQVLDAAGRGWPVGERPDEVVPIVPAAILFDLGRGGDRRHRPSANDGRDAATRALSDEPARLELGNAGAATGAIAGGLKGGIGSASAVLPDGTTVAAMVAVNAMGSPVDPATGHLFGAAAGLPGEFGTAAATPDELTAFRDLQAARTSRGRGEAPRPGQATTIGVVVTDATLTKAQCQKAAGIAHDGLARAVRPVHTMFDGDTLFALATGHKPAPEAPMLLAVMEAGAMCVSRAIAHALLAATSVDRTGQGGVRVPAYLDLFPSQRR